MNVGAVIQACLQRAFIWYKDSPSEVYGISPSSWLIAFPLFQCSPRELRNLNFSLLLIPRHPKEVCESNTRVKLDNESSATCLFGLFIMNNMFIALRDLMTPFKWPYRVKKLDKCLDCSSVHLKNQQLIDGKAIPALEVFITCSDSFYTLSLMSSI